MDFKSNKKGIKVRMKEVWDKNHPNLFELMNKNYTSLNNVIELYKIWFDKLDSLKDPKNWCEQVNKIEDYSKLDGLYAKIESNLKKAFNVVPYNFHSLKINQEEDSLTITYLDHHVHTFVIKDFTKRVKNGFRANDFNIVGEPLDFGKILDRIINNIDGYWVKNVIKYIEESKIIDENNEIAKEMNKKIYSTNIEKEAKYREIFNVIDKLKLVFPINFVNGEKIVFDNIDFNNYYLISNLNKVVFKVKSGNSFDDSITSILFDKCKVDESSIPKWLFNTELFNSLDAFEYDFKIIEEELNELIKNNKMYFVNQVDEIRLNTNKFLDNVSEEKESNNKENILNNANSVDIETIKNKVYETLLKVKGHVVKKIDIPEVILFNTNEEGLKTIDERFLDYLKCFDLSKINFDNVYLGGVDFGECTKIKIDPQKVLNKDLSNTKFNTNLFIDNASFDGVDLSNAIIIIEDDVNFDFNGAKGNPNTFINVNDKMIQINTHKL